MQIYKIYSNSQTILVEKLKGCYIFYIKRLKKRNIRIGIR